MLSQLTPSSIRWIFAAVSVICAALLGFGYFLQYGAGQQPCPLCILQRYAYLAISVVGMGAAAMGRNRIGARIGAGVIALLAAAGAALATWQVGKGDSMTNCLGDPVGDFVYRLPMRNWWPEFLAAYGGCADKHPPILGLSAPLWSLIWFIVFFAVAAFVLRRLRRGALD
jgi:disulfide bond formation protein DsbB